MRIAEQLNSELLEAKTITEAGPTDPKQVLHYLAQQLDVVKQGMKDIERIMHDVQNGKKTVSVEDVNRIGVAAKHLDTGFGVLNHIHPMGDNQTGHPIAWA